MTTSQILTVSALNRAIAETLEQRFALVWVGGEISNLTIAASGHWYFLLKDRDSQIRGVMFRGRNQGIGFVPRNGDHVEIRAQVALYGPRGELQLNAEMMRRAGQGALYEAFLRLKETLAARGWFDAARKRALPVHPRAVGIVTSPQAAALRDVLTTLRRRAPQLPVIVYPAPVQGKGAAEQLAQMIDVANARAEVDVLIVCRGGGSIEDLWAFNEEALAAAIVASALPVVAGVGHETDVTIADFVADLRAPTPTAAAELVAPDRRQLLLQLQQLQQRATRRIARQLEQQGQRLDGLARRLVSPVARQRERQARLEQAAWRLAQALRTPQVQAANRLAQARWRLAAAAPQPSALRRQLSVVVGDFYAAAAAQRQRWTQRLAQAQAQLEIVNPQRTLARGYAVLVNPDGAVVRDPRQLRPGTAVDVQLARGRAQLGIASVQARLDD